MEASPENSTDVIKRLQRCINDLASLLALPAMWSGGAPPQVAATLLDVLLNMLSLDFAYLRLEAPDGEAPVEMVRFALPQNPAISSQDIRELLKQALPADPGKWPLVTRSRMGGHDILIAPRRLGLHGEFGVIIAGSQRLDFPDQNDRLLFNVAANQAVITLQHSRLLSGQKRLAEELDQRVAQRTAELAAVNQELNLRAGLLEQIPVAAWTLRPDGTPDFVNQQWLDYSGQTLEFVRSNPEAWMTAVHPEDREAVFRDFWDGIRSGRGFAMEGRVRSGDDGAYRWNLNRAVPLRDADGKILRFVGTSTDIEDLKQSQENLRATEERTRLIIDTALDAVISIDTKGTVTHWNKQAEITFGWSKQEAIGRHMAELIVPARLRAMHERGMRHFLATGEGPALRRRIEITAVRCNGAEFPVELEILPMKLGGEWLFSAFIRDITETKEAQENLREAQANLAHIARLTTIGQLTASIAHEVNQPLAAIVTNGNACLRWLNREPPNLEEVRAATERIIRDGKRGGEVIARIRRLVKKEEAPKSLLDVNEIIRETVALLHGDLQGVALRTDLTGGLAQVNADRVQLQQVLLNLTMNAMDAMKPVTQRPHVLSIETKIHEGRAVLVAIQDTGVGLDRVQMEKLFDAFYTTKPGGLGMGLSICRSIIEGHGGRLWAESDGESGARFQFTLPVEHEMAE